MKFGVLFIADSTSKSEAVQSWVNEVILTASMASDGLSTKILFGRDVTRNNLCKMSDLIN